MQHRTLIPLLLLARVGFAAGARDTSVADRVSALMQQGSEHARQHKYAEAEAAYRASLAACKGDTGVTPCE